MTQVKTAIVNHRLKAILVATGILFLFSVFYHFTLSYSITTNTVDTEEFFSFDAYNDNAGVQFIVMYVFIILAWLLIFVVMNGLDIRLRLLTHIITLPVIVILSKDIFYILSERLNYGHLEGGGEIWDIFIPAFFYLVVFTFLHGIEFYFKSQQRLKEKNKFETDSLNFELKAIKAQLNPHFLYNVFNTINASIPKENEATREMIADLSDLFRYQLKASETDTVNLREEVDAVKTYLRLEQKRFGDRLKINYDIDEDCLYQDIPPMLIQPLIENAIKHGISPKEQGGQVDLVIKKPNGQLEVTIKDTGVGIDDLEKALTKGFGLSHTKLRIEKFYNSQLDIKSNQPQGLIVKFKI
ncbi:MAG: sensor histidine kinase [Bacteroidetes bacterium]|jgi:sensor histidine kinase YesM|nr:sensor histidine kinase [Bacteroidota bacterium]